MNNRDSIFGLCMRAGKLVSGEDMVLDAVRSGKAKLVVVAKDASERTKKTFRDKCASFGVTIVGYGNMKDLGHALGKEKRAVLAVTEEGFAKKILAIASSPQQV